MNLNTVTVTDAPPIVTRRTATISKYLIPCTSLLLLLVILADLSLSPSGVSVHLPEVIQSISHHVFHSHLSESMIQNNSDQIVWQIHFPRALLAAIVGALLACSGVGLQSLLLNPLADPYTVGVSSGAAVGAMVAELLGLGLMLNGFATMSVAFLFGILAVIAVYALARARGKVSVESFLLAGIVVGTMLWSSIPLLLTLSHRSNDYGRIIYTLLGSLQSSDWSRVELIIPIFVVGFLMMQRWSRELNLMSFGEEAAHNLGLPVETIKQQIVIVTSLMTAAAVSTCGIVAFVGLIVPHIARKITGPDHRTLLPLAAIIGSILLIVSDTVVRVYLM